MSHVAWQNSYDIAMVYLAELICSVPPKKLGYYHVAGFNFKNDHKGELSKSLGHSIQMYEHYLAKGMSTNRLSLKNPFPFLSKIDVIYVWNCWTPKDQLDDELDLKLEKSDDDNFEKMTDSWFSSCSINWN